MGKLLGALVAASFVVPRALSGQMVQTTCHNGARQTACWVRLVESTLELRLDNGFRLEAKRLGRWRINNKDGVTTRSSNARIDLQGEVVYGVLRISSDTGTSLIWPQQRIEIPDLHLHPSP